MTQDMCGNMCSPSTSGRWQIYFRFQSDSPITVTVRVHYSWKGV
jgi:hypothetical protein